MLYREWVGLKSVSGGLAARNNHPGTIRVTKEEFYAGGNSDPRNPNILKMFALSMLVSVPEVALIRL